MSSKLRRKLERILSEYGLTLEHRAKHYAILRDDKIVNTVSGTGELNALRQCMRQLRRDGFVDDAACRIKF